MKMSYFFKQTHISRKRIVLIFSDLLRQITLCLSSKDESATLKNSDTGAKFLTLFNMNWTLVSKPNLSNISLYVTFTIK